MRKKNRFIYSTILCALLAIFAFAFSSLAAKPDPPKTRNVRITTGSAEIDLDKKQYNIPGKVTVEMDDITLTGADVAYDEETRKLQIRRPPVQIHYRDDIDATTGPIDADLEKQTVDASGGCEVRQNSPGGNLVAKSDRVHIDQTNNIVNIIGDVTIEHTDTKPPKKEPNDYLLKNIKPETIKFETERIDYNSKAHIVDAPGKVLITTPEGWIKTSGVHADLENKTIETDAAVEIQFRNVNIRGNRIRANYAKKVIIIDGDIRVQRENSVLTGTKVEYSYNKIKRYLHLTGPADLNLKVEKKKEK